MMNDMSLGYEKLDNQMESEMVLLFVLLFSLMLKIWDIGQMRVIGVFFSQFVCEMKYRVNIWGLGKKGFYFILVFKFDNKIKM